MTATLENKSSFGIGVHVTYEPMHGRTTGSNKKFVGYAAGSSLTTGSTNMFIGSFSGKSKTTGESKRLIGYQVGLPTTVSNNTLTAEKSSSSSHHIEMIDPTVKPDFLKYNEEHGTVFDDVKFNFEPSPSVIRVSKDVTLVKNWFDPLSCDQLVRKMEKWKVEKKCFSFGTGDDDFCSDLQASPSFANLLYHHLTTSNLVPTTYKGLTLQGIGASIAWAKYEKGQKFKAHKDTPTRHANGDSKIIGLLYLNDDFEGGRTKYYPDYPLLSPCIAITPQKGSLVLFDIDMWHEGCEVKDGNKYWLGFELIYG